MVAGLLGEQTTEPRSIKSSKNPIVCNGTPVQFLGPQGGLDSGPRYVEPLTPNGGRGVAISKTHTSGALEIIPESINTKRRFEEWLCATHTRLHRGLDPQARRRDKIVARKKRRDTT